MKKFIIFIISLFMILSLISCSKPKNYTVLEIYGCEHSHFPGANHQSEIDFSIETYMKSSIDSKKTVELLGSVWEVEYMESQKHYYYKSNIDHYETYSKGARVKVDINEDTGVIEGYSIQDERYLDKNKGSVVLGKEDCVNIARTYLNEYIDSDEYEIFEVTYGENKLYESVYNVSFRRVINGIKTSDRAFVRVTVFGDVIEHSFDSLGYMAEATLPSREEMKAMDDSVYAKLDTIYENISSEYEKISYEIDEKIFVRLSDGKYAFEYYVDVTLEKGGDSKPFTELTRLIVYV